MCLRCGACLTQWILFILNFLLSLVGLAIVGLGVVVIIQLKKLDEADLDGADSMGIIVIVVGCIFTAIFFCGCCGAFCKNRCLLTTYSVIMILLATATVVLTVFIYKSVDPIKEAIQEWLLDNFQIENYEEIFAMIETAVGCCGTTGPDSYNSTQIPVSCCPSTLQTIQTILNSTSTQDISNYTDTSVTELLTCSASDAYQDGCVQLFAEYVGKIISAIGQGFIWVIVVQYAAAFLAIFLTCYAGRKGTNA